MMCKENCAIVFSHLVHYISLWRWCKVNCYGTDYPMGDATDGICFTLCLIGLLAFLYCPKESKHPNWYAAFSSFIPFIVGFYHFVHKMHRNHTSFINTVGWEDLIAGGISIITSIISHIFHKKKTNSLNPNRLETQKNGVSSKTVVLG